MESSSSFSSSSESDWVVELRRKHVVAAASAFVISKTTRGTGPKQKSNWNKWLTHVNNLGQRNFRRMYRMDIQSFNQLHDLLHETLQTVDKKQASRSSGSDICSQIHLEVAIRYLAGGSLWDIHDNFGLSVYEFCRSVWRLIDAINSQSIQRQIWYWGWSDTCRNWNSVCKEI